MVTNVSINPIDSDVFFCGATTKRAQTTTQQLPNFLLSMEISEMHTKEMPILSTVATSEPDFVTFDDYSNDPTSPYWFRAQQPTVPPCLNELNLPPNPSTILAIMALVRANPTQRDKKYILQSPDPSEPSPFQPHP